MNKERIIKIAEVLESQDYSEISRLVEDPVFDMCHVLTPTDGYCGTRMCIAGHAVVMFSPREQWFRLDLSTSQQAGALLGLDHELAEELFFPDDSDVYRSTPKQAAKVLRHLAKTGVVDWSVAGEP